MQASPARHKTSDGNTLRRALTYDDEMLHQKSPPFASDLGLQRDESVNQNADDQDNSAKKKSKACAIFWHTFVIALIHILVWGDPLPFKHGP